MAFTDPRSRKPIADDLVGEALEDLQDQITNFIPAPLTPADAVADVEVASGSSAGGNKAAVDELQTQFNLLLANLRTAGLLAE